MLFNGMLARPLNAGRVAALPFLAGAFGMLSSGTLSDKLARSGMSLTTIHRSNLIFGMIVSAASTFVVAQSRSTVQAVAAISMALFFIHFAGTSGWGYVQAVSPLRGFARNAAELRQLHDRFGSRWAHRLAARSHAFISNRLRSLQHRYAAWSLKLCDASSSQWNASRAESIVGSSSTCISFISADPASLGRYTLVADSGWNYSKSISEIISDSCLRLLATYAVPMENSHLSFPSHELLIPLPGDCGKFVSRANLNSFVTRPEAMQDFEMSVALRYLAFEPAERITSISARYKRNLVIQRHINNLFDKSFRLSVRTFVDYDQTAGDERVSVLAKTYKDRISMDPSIGLFLLYQEFRDSSA
jgi:hypothetical protein